jgi:hydroxymethylbilane synthase
MRNKLRVGTRKSKLAMWQTNYVVHLMRFFDPSLEVEIVPITTKGDKILDAPLAKIGDKGLFTKEIEEALLRGEIDMAVHSLKDLPTKLPEGLTIAAYTTRDYPFDVLVSREGKKLKELPAGAVVGTSSLRRKAQLKRFRPDLQIKDIRGNVDTRLRKLDEGQYDAIILAQSSLERLGWGDRITEVLDYFIPAVGQGIMAVETREDDKELIEFLRRSVNDIGSEAEAKAEREFLRTLEGGCQVPMGAFAVVEMDGSLTIRGFVSDLEGKNYYEASVKGHAQYAEAAGHELAQKLLQMGAGEVLKCLKDGKTDS